ncbi:MAG: class F sortase [Candidatus Pacebacteria bacterium]|nr:class F sortase [Candidatus Paceibacterota bacterium]
MDRNLVRKALGISAAGYLIITAFVFWNEGGLTIDKKAVAEADASPAAFLKNERGEGRWLLIPKIDVDAKIQTVGTMPNGSIGIPSNAQDVAWFAGSSPIATVGTAVVVGHLDTHVFGPGVFRGLKGLVKGDALYTSIDGRIGHFTVTRIEVYPEGTDRMDEVIGTRQGKARLVLITCDGKWDQSVKRYTERLVVFAE